MNKKGFLLICLGFILVIPLSCFELGLFTGPLTKPSRLVYGVSGSLGIIAPLLKIETEIYDITESPLKGITTAVKVKAKVRRLGFFGVLGVGAEFEKLNFRFSQYRGFYFLGGGIHLYLKTLLSLRGDLRLLSFSKASKIRFTVGIFLHL